VGAAAGFLGCCFYGLTAGVSIPPALVQVGVVFGALAGATCLLYLRLVVWTYTSLRGGCRLNPKSLN
jgi:hypothetical protein